MDHAKNMELAASIENKLSSLPALSNYCCIYKVPEYLRDISEESYRPFAVSIGPFHHGDERLQALEEEKLRYLQFYKNRLKNKNLADVIRMIRDQELIIREHYAENVELSSDEFTEMVLVDGAFIVELFLRNYSPQLLEENDKIFKKPRAIDDVIRDMKILENQLPFYLLVKLYDFTIGNESASLSSFIDLACHFFQVPRVETTMYLHFVDLLRAGYLPKSSTRMVNSAIDKCPSVKDLYEAGVRFVKGKGKHLLDIKFQNGVLEIPQMDLEDYTESLFRNVTAFEQRHCYFDSYITDYIKMMDYLIDDPKDVEILAQCGIIKNCLGNNDEAADMLNGLAKNIRYAKYNFYYSGICGQLHAYYNTPWHRHKATLHHKYLRHPWAAISLIYAVMLLILTLLSTIFTVFAGIQYA